MMKQMINGVTYHFEIHGKGAPLLLLHGFTGSVNTWAPFLKEWGEGFQVIAVDIIGHGKTDSPSDPARYEMGQVVEDIYGLLQGLNIQSIHLLGYSMGGRLALSFACAYPEMVTSLIVESSSPGLKDEREQHARTDADEALASRIETEGITSFVDYWENIPLFAPTKRLDKAIQEKIRQERLAQKAMGLANSLRGMGTGKQPSLWHCLPECKFPVLLLAGDEDEKFIKIANEMEKDLPNAKKILINDSGHMIHVEQPQIFGKIIKDWLMQVQT